MTSTEPDTQVEPSSATEPAPVSPAAWTTKTDFRRLQIAASEESDDWVTTYMDLITLLLTVFIVLLAYAEHNGSQALDAMAKGARDMPRAHASMIDSLTSVEEPGDSLIPVSDSLRRAFAESGLAESVDISNSPGKLTIQLSDKILFASGAADFGPQAIASLQPLLTLLTDSAYDIVVEGHTDSVPISTPRFPSNWELSAARASAVVRYLVDAGITPQRLRATGLADSQPLSDNETVEGRARNRRVTLILTTEAE